ncbi:MAG: hypothetical protein ACREVD_03770 [Burkholderiales bacterium]
MLATIFFLTSLGLAYLASEKPRTEAGTVMDAVKPQPQPPASGDIPTPQALPPAGGDSGSPASGIPK